MRKRVQQARLQTLKSEFEMLHMKEDETIDIFTTKLTTLVNKAASLGHTMEDETLVRKLLNAVPDRRIIVFASIIVLLLATSSYAWLALSLIATVALMLHGKFKMQRISNENQIGNGNLVAVRAEGNAAGHNGNQIRCYNCMGVGHFARDCTVRPRRRDVSYLQTHLLIAQKEEAGIQLQAEEYDLMAAAADLDEIEKVNANCILMANLQQASSLGTQTDSAPVYDSDGSAEGNRLGRLDHGLTYF
nr:zinc finger, CCHC-type [Tanacetum cinerariifolium]